MSISGSESGNWHEGFERRGKVGKEKEEISKRMTLLLRRLAGRFN